MKKPYDTLKVYNSILKMYEYYTKCDELAEIPNAVSYTHLMEALTASPKSPSFMTNCFLLYTSDAMQQKDVYKRQLYYLAFIPT